MAAVGCRSAASPVEIWSETYRRAQKSSRLFTCVGRYRFKHRNGVRNAAAKLNPTQSAAPPRAGSRRQQPSHDGHSFLPHRQNRAQLLLRPDELRLVFAVHVMHPGEALLDLGIG
jgi:hypothetical protein